LKSGSVLIKDPPQRTGETEISQRSSALTLLLMFSAVEKIQTVPLHNISMFNISFSFWP